MAERASSSGSRGSAKRKPPRPSPSDPRGTSPPAMGGEQAMPSAGGSASAAGKEGSADVRPDPLESILGNSTYLRPVLEWTWPATSHPFLASSVQSACCGAYARVVARAMVGERGRDQRVLITATDLVAAIFALPRIDPAAWTAQIEPSLPSLGADLERLFPQKAFEIWKAHPTPSRARLVGGVLRWDAVSLLAEASRLRRRTNKRHESIGLRHVCFSALTTREGQQALQELGLLSVGLPQLASFLSGQIDLQLLKRKYWDEPVEWQGLLARVRNQPLLINPPSRRRSGFTSDLPVGAAGAAAPAGADPLGTRADATALADLILLEAAEPPLAVGLFGSWGSGKSTLIGWLKQEIRRQSEEEKELRVRMAEGAKEAPSEAAGDHQDPQARRVVNVAQIEFNAWSFIDSQNLWASLTSEIFEQLRTGGEEERTRDAGRELVRGLADKVTAKKLAASEASAVTDQKEAEFALAEAELKEVVAAREDTLGAAARAVLDDSDAPLPPRIADALRNLFEGDLPTRARGFLGKWRSVWSVWKTAQPRRYRLTLALFAFTLLLAGLLTISEVREAVAAWWLSLPGIGLLGTLFVAGRPLAAIGQAIGRYADEVDRKNRTLAAEESRKREAVETARRARDLAISAQDTAIGEAASLEATAIDPAKLLTYLLTESADIQSIRGHLGVLGAVRRCFETLDELIQQQRSRPDSIERIVLYIDDLDRCSASQVVQILEAVHLLLAFKCFVVVVAIDARWLRRSLVISHPQFKPVAVGADVRSDPIQADDLPTPSDYLEKIFQIPFWVSSMATEPDTAQQTSPYNRYLEQLLGPAPLDERSEARAGEDEGDAGPGAAPLAPLSPAAVDFRDDRPAHGERVQLTGPERTLLGKLGPLAAKSPRAVKRLVNIYRLIRARVTQDQEQAFLTGGSSGLPSFAAVQFALALDAGLPAHLVLEVRRLFAAFSPVAWQILAETPALLARPAHEVFSVTMSHNPDVDLLDTLKALLSRAGRLGGFVEALEAVKDARGGLLDRPDIERGFALTQRYSFRPT